VSSLTRLLGGKISVQSTPDVGTEFMLTMGFTPTAATLPVAAEAASEAHGAGRLLGVRVLVVDDSEINQEVAKRILELDGATLRLAADGQQAIELLQSEPGSIDIVLMDVQMPVLDGCEATRRIRAELGLTTLPIVAVTAGALSNERQRAYAAGMNDFISKPFDAPALTRCVLRHLRPANLEFDSPGGVLTNPADGIPAPWPAIEGIDAEDARGRWAGDTDLFLSMLERLLDEFGEVRAPPADADAGMLANLARAMHKLRGGACMLGAKEIQTLAADLETACSLQFAHELPRRAATLTALLQNLRLGAGPAIAAARARSALRSAAPTGGLESRQISELVQLLREQSLAAGPRLRGMSAALQRELGRALHGRLHEHVDHLRFDAAAELLEELLAQRRQPAAPGGVAPRRA
jgi:CheY-like chemotaxis protein